jgi:hypothetical protein
MMLMNVFTDIWEVIVKYYTLYSEMIHSVFPSQLGDLVEGILDIIIVCAIIKIIADAAFKTKVQS